MQDRAPPQVLAVFAVMRQTLGHHGDGLAAAVLADDAHALLNALVTLRLVLCLQLHRLSPNAASQAALISSSSGGGAPRTPCGTVSARHSSRRAHPGR